MMQPLALSRANPAISRSGWRGIRRLVTVMNFALLAFPLRPRRCLFLGNTAPIKTPRAAKTRRYPAQLRRCGDAAHRSSTRIDLTRPLAHRVEEFSKSAASVPDLGNVAAQPCVETEAAPGRVDCEQQHQCCEKYVAPRPLGRIAGFINAEPQVQHVEHRDNADEAHAEPQDQRNSEDELGEEYERVENFEIG